MSAVRPDFSNNRPAGEAGSKTKLRRAVITTALLAPLALLSTSYSLAVALDTRNPEVSQQIYQALPKAKERLGDLAIATALDGKPLTQAQVPAPSAAMLAMNMSSDRRLEVEGLAISGLIDTPYAPGALRQLAFVEPGNARRRSLLELSYRSSRRDIATAAQIAEIQFRDRQPAQGLETIDTALVVSDRLDTQLFPLMLSGTQDREFALLLRDRLAQDPSWSERLARFSGRSVRSAALFAYIANDLPASSPARSIDYGAPLVDQLATQLQPSAAFAAYAAYSQSEQKPSRFGAGPLPPIDWKLLDNLDAGARPIGVSGSVVEVFASPRRSGEFARILLRLETGNYKLSFNLSDPRGAGGNLGLVRTCLEDGRELSSSETQAALDGQRVSLDFLVPAKCPFQTLRMQVSSDNEAISALIDAVEINRAPIGGNQ
ncbi:MAG: hypothetical protein AAFY07_04580 [Pseudomonadota bacterium]